MTDPKSDPDNAPALPVSIDRIMECLPHRYPFLLIDRVIAMVPDQEITAIKNITFNEPFFQGHFPGNPVMPGVLIIEAMAQAGGVLVIESAPGGRQGQSVLFMGIDKARFRRRVVPGDVLRLDVGILQQRRKVVRMRGQAYVGDELAAEAELLASFGDEIA